MWPIVAFRAGRRLRRSLRAYEPVTPGSALGIGDILGRPPVDLPSPAQVYPLRTDPSVTDYLHP